MLDQGSVGTQEASLHFQVDAHQPSSSHGVGLQKRRLLWTGLGVGLVLLLGVSAWAFHPSMSRSQTASSQQSSHHSMVAFAPSFGAASLRTGGLRPMASRAGAFPVRPMASKSTPRMVSDGNEPSSPARVSDLRMVSEDDEPTPGGNNFADMDQAELELMYVDVLWNLYDGNNKVMSDDLYDELKVELSWKGSGFPSLRRQEIAFVKAAIAFAKGEPSVTDEQWQVMKNDVKASTGKRKEVTEFLLYARSLKETSEIREKLEKEMCDAGIAVKVSPTGLSCTLSDVSTGLLNNVRDVLEMYVALSLVPTAIFTSAWAVVALIAGGPGALFDTATVGFAGSGVGSFFLTKELIRYVELTQPQLLEGSCPCCESNIRFMATSSSGTEAQLTCGKCATDLGIDLFNRQVGKAQGFNLVGGDSSKEEEGGRGKWLDDVLTRAALTTSDVVLGKPGEETRLGAGAKGGKKEKVAPGTTKLEYSLEHLKDGIFAWSILVGYGLFGETFIARLRGKGIQLHSQAINAFCERYAIPKKVNQRYIATAKRNGHDLGFLVDGQKLFGDGIFGKEAMAWWKEQKF